MFFTTKNGNISFYEKIGDKFILSKNPYTTFRTIARSKVVNR